MSGVRSSKTVNGVSYEYTTLSGKITRMTWSGNAVDIVYDDAGRPYLLRYTPSGGATQTYYYVLNLQGDVVGLMNTSMQMVVKYSYDPWGKLTGTTATSAYVALAQANPLRYRSYCYDIETGFYYLQTRYYDPTIARFINADGYLSTDVEGLLSANMFAYCLNNPVNRFDLDGNWSLPNWAKVAIGAVAIAGLAVATVCTAGTAAVVCGAALSGAVAGGASGAVIGAVEGGVSDGWQGALDGACSGFMYGTLIGGATGAASAGLNIATGTTTIIGKAHASPLHKLATNIEAGKMAASGQYVRIGMNRALKTLGLNGARRPDAIGVAKNGFDVLVEVVSPKQSTVKMVEKIGEMTSYNPGSVGKVVTWVRDLYK